MKPIDEKLAKLANKAEIKVNDRSKEEKQAYDKGFVTGVLSIALEFELDKEEVASFLEERRALTMAVELLESKRPHGKWEIVDAEGDRIWNCVCSECRHDPQEHIGGTENWWLRKPLPNYCPECGADMRGDEE